MKRVISMILAVMLIVTLGVLPAAAEEHTEHFFSFLDPYGDPSYEIHLPPATVGREYSYTIGVSSCGKITKFHLDSEWLPAGLNFNEATGEIYGTPTAPTTEEMPLIISAIESDCEEFLSNEATFYLAVSPVETMTIPFVKVVEQKGNKKPGKQTFTFETFEYGVSGMDLDQIKITDNSIETNGPGEYKGEMTLEYPAHYAGDLSEGFHVREVNDNAAYWVYSDMVWFIQPNRENGCYIREENPNGSTRDEMLFVNEYTYSYSRDDDDDDRPAKQPEPEKVEPVNPETGGSTWDYLVYLFQRYFF